MNDAVAYEMNKSYDVNVFSNGEESFIQLTDVVNNSQNNFFLNIKPEPNWFLLNFAKQESFEKSSNVNQNFRFLQDKIQTKDLVLTGRFRNILGIEAKEYAFKDEDFEYTYWLGDFNNYTISPLYDQFDQQIILEAFSKSIKMENAGGKREIKYSLKSIEKQKFNFGKLYPKKYITKVKYLEIINQNQ